MGTRFCEHLDEYGAQYIRTEASYQQCVNLLDRIMSGSPEAELVALVSAALQEWSVEDAKLREMLVAAVRAGHVRVPLALVQRAQNTNRNRKAHYSGHMICAICRSVVPRLTYPEWKIASNGVTSFKGHELPVLAAV